MPWGRPKHGAKGPGLSPRPREEQSAHYFQDAEDSSPSRLSEVKKVLEEISTLEECAQNGKQLSLSQMKKIQSKATLEGELRGLEAGDSEEGLLAELLKEKEELDAELSPAAQARAVQPELPGEVRTPNAKSGKACHLPIPTAAARTKLAPWGKPSQSSSRPSSRTPQHKPQTPQSPQSPSPASTEVRSPSATPSSAARAVRMPIPVKATAEQRQQLESDLAFWGRKFASQAQIQQAAVVAELSHEAMASEDAKAELMALVEYDLELPEGALSRGAVAITTPQNRQTDTSEGLSDLSDPDSVFACCNTDGSGMLDVHELKFAFNAFGLFPGLDYIRSWMGHCERLDRKAFRALLDSKLRSAPQSMRGPKTLPYSRRGVRMGQVEGLHDTFISSEWLQQKCNNFNMEHQSDIQTGKSFAMATNLYALNQWVIMPGTCPNSEELPEELRRSAGMPVAQHESSFAELMNPDGLGVDYFVSHFWGHPFKDTCAALRSWSSQVHWQIGRPQMSMVYWICLLALNQHRPSEEVGSSPEEGPFNCALVQSACGAVMVLDESVAPFSRIWCLFEVKRLTDLKKDFHLISAQGAMGSNLVDMEPAQRQTLVAFTSRVASALECVSAFQAKSSSEDDKFAIWHRVADPQLQKVPLAVARERSLFNANVFKRFDTTIRSLLAAPLYQTSLLEDASGALRYIGMGAPFGASDLQLLRDRGVDVCKVEVGVQSGTQRVGWQLLHIAAYFGHMEAAKELVRLRASLEAKTKFRLTPLQQAARNGQEEMCTLLLSSKANLRTTAIQGRTALQNAAHQGHDGVVRILLEHQADPNAGDERGVTALHSAAMSGHTDTVKVLLLYRADPTVRQSDDRNALHLAAECGSVEVAQEIVERSPQKGALLTAQSRKGSALDLAATTEMADFLQSITET
ncbi:unnamed protein product [Effrenium voratum]|nr:unnamed protein product [Effrenium voratum]